MLVYDYDPHDPSWRVIGQGDGRHEAEGIAWREKIFRALPVYPPGATYGDLTERFNADKRKWLGALTKMVDEGVVDTSGDGVKGDPKRFWRGNSDSVQGSRPRAQTERDGNGSGAAIPIPSAPVGVREWNSKPERQWFAFRPGCRTG